MLKNKKRREDSEAAIKIELHFAINLPKMDVNFAREL